MNGALAWLAYPEGVMPPLDGGEYCARFRITDLKVLMWLL
jgi:hypothetical protein